MRIHKAQLCGGVYAGLGGQATLPKSKSHKSIVMFGPDFVRKLDNVTIDFHKHSKPIGISKNTEEDIFGAGGKTRYLAQNNRLYTTRKAFTNYLEKEHDILDEDKQNEIAEKARIPDRTYQKWVEEGKITKRNRNVFLTAGESEADEIPKSPVDEDYATPDEYSPKSTRSEEKEEKKTKPMKRPPKLEKIESESESEQAPKAKNKQKKAKKQAKRQAQIDTGKTVEEVKRKQKSREDDLLAPILAMQDLTSTTERSGKTDETSKLNELIKAVKGETEPKRAPKKKPSKQKKTLVVQSQEAIKEKENIRAKTHSVKATALKPKKKIGKQTKKRLIVQ